jgi:hypothetical protein
MITRISTALTAGLLLVVATACSETVGGNTTTKSPDGLRYAHVLTTAPSLCADSAGAWAFKGNGQDFELSLNFAPCQGGEEFLRLKFDDRALALFPDGTPIADGDSVFISAVWAGGDSVLFHLNPTGLVFAPTDPAELHLHYGETEERDDAMVLGQLGIWRQPTLADPFTRLSSTRHEDSEELEAKLNGFSRYAIAY